MLKTAMSVQIVIDSTKPPRPGSRPRCVSAEACEDLRMKTRAAAFCNFRATVFGVNTCYRDGHELVVLMLTLSSGAPWVTLALVLAPDWVWRPRRTSWLGIFAHPKTRPPLQNSPATTGPSIDQTSYWTRLVLIINSSSVSKYLNPSHSGCEGCCASNLMRHREQHCPKIAASAHGRRHVSLMKLKCCSFLEWMQISRGERRGQALGALLLSRLCKLVAPLEGWLARHLNRSADEFSLAQGHCFSSNKE